jgi:hypothetical protein
MRSTLLLLTASLLVTLACSSSSSSTVAEDASALPAEDASSAPCTSAGGTCVPYTTTCPVLQQNATLCGDSVMLCCLPPEDAAPIISPGVDSGTGPTDAASEATGD